ncbi:MAG: hypothetical protein ACI9JM_002914 [Halioglobus sp.]|jgi:hypothetical protein
MKIAALIYLTIALVNFWIWFNNGVEMEVFLTPAFFLTWGLYVFGLLSFLAFAVRMLIVPRRVWQLVFVVYCSTRLYELMTRGLTLSGGDLATDLNIIASYLWLVIPAGLTTWYMGFVFRVPKPLPVPRLKKEEYDHGAIFHPHYTEQLP